MAKPPTLTDEQKNQLMVWAVQDKMRPTDLVGLLKETYNLVLTLRNVEDIVSREKRLRGLITKQVVQENLGHFITKDLDIIRATKDNLNAKIKQFEDAGDWNNFHKTIASLKDWVKLSLEFSGANEKERESVAQNARFDLMLDLKRFAKDQEINRPGRNANTIQETESTDEDEEQGGTTERLLPAQQD